MKTDISIIIPTAYKEKYLDLILYCLLKQNWQLFEVIVVENSNENLSENLCNKYSRAGLNVKYLHMPELINPSEQRNFGALRASSTNLLFLDDDRLTSINNLEKHIMKLSHHKIVVGNRWELYKGLTENDLLIIKNELEKNEYEFMQKKGHMEPFQKVLNENSNSYKKYPWLFFMTGNLSIKKDVFFKYKFDSSFDRLEDLELGYRLSLDGISPVYDKEIDSYHLLHSRKNYNKNLTNTMEKFYEKYRSKEILKLKKYFIGEIEFSDFMRCNND